MKKLFLTLCVALISLGASAQQGTCTFGIQGSYMLNGNNNFGLGANIGYEFVDNFRGVAEFDYYFKKDYVSGWEVDANVEYLLRVANNKFTIYPLLGMNVFGAKSEYGGSDSKVGVNVGAGFEFPVTEKLAIKVEYNYKTQGDGGHFLKAGVVIPF